eukprot:NODE_482_length_6938_cov_0.582541.p5 type:complete len:142 gc:universal NODE_482_length_6938_cov_0.582541:888-463(-)
MDLRLRLLLWFGGCLISSIVSLPGAFAIVCTLLNLFQIIAILTTNDEIKTMAPRVHLPASYLQAALILLSCIHTSYSVFDIMHSLYKIVYCGIFMYFSLFIDILLKEYLKEFVDRSDMAYGHQLVPNEDSDDEYGDLEAQK